MAAETILILGESGTGKSTSLRNLDPEETFIISTTGKPLPFKGYKKKYKPLVTKGELNGNYFVSSNYEQIIKVLKVINAKMPNIKQIVIDDFQYMLSYEFMDRAGEKGYDKFTELAQHVVEVVRTAEILRDDCKLIFLSHSENVGDSINPKYAMKTIGKLLNEKITLEGIFTYVFYTMLSEGENGIEYKFLTNTDGVHVAKTPLGMFDDQLIDNDMKVIIEKIDAYNNGE